MVQRRSSEGTGGEPQQTHITDFANSRASVESAYSRASTGTVYSNAGGYQSQRIEQGRFSVPAAPSTWGPQSGSIAPGAPSNAASGARSRATTVGFAAEPHSEIPYEEWSCTSSDVHYSEAGESEWWTPTRAASTATSRRSTLTGSAGMGSFAGGRRSTANDGTGSAPLPRFRTSWHNVDYSDEE